MATAYSTLLGLALPVQGELSGTWGDMVDNGITRYVDIAVAGTVTLTNDGAVTLSLTNGDSSATNIVSSLTGAGTVSAQFAIIKVTGTLTTAKILTPPSSSRTYVVVNAATGSTVTVKASGQTGVSIAVGETAFVYFNGTDYVKVAGTVNTGVTSFQTSLSGLTPSTATTGAVTLAGTLGTANGGTNLTSFTSGGVVYASSSSALATGSALTFDGQYVSIGAGASSPNGIKFLATGGGLAANLTVNHSTGEIQNFATTNYFQTWYANNAEKMKLDTSGNLGIGATATALGAGYTTVDVRGITGGGQRWGNATNSSYIYSDSNETNLATATNKPLLFSVNATEVFRATSSSLYTASGINVGIGTSSPNGRLEVVGSTGASFNGWFRTGDATAANNAGGGFYNTSSATATSRRAVLALDADGANLGGGDYFTIEKSGNSGVADILQYSNAAIRFGTNFTSRAAYDMTLDSAGNLGLGVTPSAWGGGFKAFETNGTSLGSNATGSSYYLQNSYYNGTNFIYTTTAAASYYQQITGAHRWYNAASGTAGNAISFTQAMTLDASGNLGVGTTSPTQRIHISTASGGSSLLVANGTNSASNIYVGTDGFAATTGSIYTNGSAPLAFGTNSTERARISSTGGFSVGTTADPGAGAIYATGNITAYYSDARLKTVSGKIENALDKVGKLSGVYYTNNSVAKSFGYDSDEVQVGVLAQDVEAVLPQIVKAAPFDLDQDGNSKSGENYKTVQYERLVPLLIEAINELQAKVKALESK